MYKEFNPVLVLRWYKEEDVLRILNKEKSYLKDDEEFNSRFFDKKAIKDKIKLGKPVFLFYLCEAKIEARFDTVFVGSGYDFGLWKLSWQAMAVEQFKKYPNKKFFINTKYPDRIQVPIPNNVFVNLKHEMNY